MLLLRLIFLVVPILAATFNAKSGKKQELDPVTEHLQNLERDIIELEKEQLNKESIVNNGGNTKNRNLITKRKEDLSKATKNLEDAIKKRNGKNSVEKTPAVDETNLFLCM